MQVVPHKKECTRYRAITKARRTKFFKRYPNYCKHCGAYGYIGIKNYWGELDEEPCKHCLGKDLCPRCMTPTVVERKDGSTTWNTCTVCRWRDDDDFGDRYCVPFEAKCICEKPEED